MSHDRQAAKQKELQTRAELGPRFPRSPRLERPTAEPRQNFRIRSGGAGPGHPTRDEGSQ